jgi:hypothetical protein
VKIDSNFIAQIELLYPDDESKLTEGLNAADQCGKLSTHNAQYKFILLML